MEKIKIIDENFEQKCTGCGACANVCPVGAIEMVEGYHTFKYPKINEQKCIHCGLCKKTCIVNNFSNNNEAKPNLFAAKANDEIRKLSSSGGLFYIFAKEIISKGGVVYGVTLDNNLIVKHIRIDNLNDISKCQGSKYVQSDTGLIYKEVKKDLENAKDILFTGCPCQIAGLKNYLNKQYDNLFCVDIVCHGVPSQKAFSMYLEEKSNGHPITNVKFRDKENGWRADIIKIEYENQPPYSLSWGQQDEFEVGFQQNLILRDCCENCKFCDFPRVGDISIGDFWGIEKYITNDGKGTSLLFINNKHGEEFFNSIKETLSFCKEMTIPLSEIRNRIHSFYPHNENKHLFFDNLKHNAFCDSVNIAKKGLYDVAIVGIPTIDNFGGSLTYVALYNAVKELGFTCFMIERPTYSKHPPADIKNIYYKNPFNTKIINNLKTKSEYASLNNLANCFLVGSDQLFHHTLYNNFSQFSTLDWVEDRKRKVAYAASFGHDTFTGDDNERAEMSHYMKKFDAFSVRETSGVQLAKKEFGVDSTQVLDPVFLCNLDVYFKLAQESKLKHESKYISSYILDPNDSKSKLLSQIESILGLKSEIYSEMFYNENSIKQKWDRPIQFGNINDRINSMINSDYIVTDSFHGTCFAIIFKKQFIAIKNAGRGVARFESLLGKLGLMDRLVSPDTKLDNSKILSKIDYNKVYKILNEEIKNDKNWLKSNLTDEVKKSFSTEDILIKKLMRENSNLKKQINLLYQFLSLEYANENDIIKYLKTLFKYKANLLILISAKDTPGMSINSEINKCLQELGIKTDLTTKHWCGFNAIIDCGQNVEEICEYDKSVSSKYEQNNLKIEMFSGPLHDGNRSKIIINGTDYSVNSRGLNFVIYDTNKNKVTDCVGFDTHDRRLTCSRK